ncbi:MAG TPA: DNA internalization-related competence protein ComEC/Rec2 [Gemmatimonadaceae bacterium]|nr:DNA internalization-related competence protein ComEC/Rec2 [Gemmatimonadaceae bacterium]
MPLVARAAAGYAIGLAVGLTCRAGVMMSAVAAALLLALIASRRQRSPLAALAAVTAAGILVGAADLRQQSACAARLVAAREWHAEFEAPAQAGGVGRARLSTEGCASHATLLVSSGQAGAGNVAMVRGIASADPRGLFVRSARIRDARRRPSLASLRARAGERIDRIFGSDAPVVRALVIGDMTLIPPAQRDRFARAGLVHMLSVSGLHVAIIALALELLAGALRLPKRPARLLTVALLAAYVAGIGAPPPAVRAAVMLGLLIASRTMQRPTSPWAVLAVGGVAPLVVPGTVLDLGWQLSVAGTIALVAGGALARRTIPRGWRGAWRSSARAAIVSVVATIVTAPLVAWTFGRVALLGPVTNLVADPVMGLLQPVLFLAICVPVRSVERMLADAAHLLLAAFDGIAVHAAAIPGAAPLVYPTMLAALAGAVAAIAVVVACLVERPARACIIALGCVALMTAEPLLQRPRDFTEMHMLDVGQGDALALRTRRGRWVVVDAGRSWASGDAGRSVVVPYIAHRGGRVALFALSHPHADHVGGAASLFGALHPALFLDPGYVGTTPPYLAALAEARADGIPWRRVHPGDSVVVDETVITALAPDSAWAAGLNDANLASTVLMVRVGHVRMLLTGDAEAPEEDWLLSHAGDALKADVLKVAHHGSSTSTTEAFLTAVHPRLALVSVGANNSYGHPDAEVLARLGSAGIPTLRTDLAGTIIVRTDGTRLEVEARGERWSLDPRP